MRKILVLLFTVISFCASAQIRINQIEAKDTARFIMVSDTVIEDGVSYDQLKWRPLDSLFKWIALDTLGLDSSLWYRIGNNSMLQKHSSELQPSNIIIGDGAGESLFDINGQHNIFMGEGSGASAVNADHNTFLGYQSGKDMVDGESNDVNIGIGFRTGQFVDGTHNIMMGREAGRYNLSDYSTIIGPYAGTENTGDNSTLIGRLAGHENTGDILTAVGFGAGLYNTGTANISLGYYAGRHAAGGHNFIGGYQAGYNSSFSGSHNVLLGHSAGYSATTMSNNVLLGYRAGYRNVSSGNNIAVGADALFNATGGGNIGIGGSALRGTNTQFSGTHNVGIGFQTGLDLTTGGSNTFAGYRAGYNVTTGGANAMYGANSGLSLTTGINNTFIGANSGYSIKTGNHNTALGYQALYASGGGTTVGNFNVALGYQSAFSITAGSGNIFAGYQSGRFNKGSYNVGIGYQAFVNHGGSNNIAIGRAALAGLTTSTGSLNTAVGMYTGNGITTGTGNTMMGYDAGRTLTTGIYNTFAGYQSGRSVSTGTYNLIMGNQAGYASNGSYNVLLGHGSGYSTTGNNNVFSGYLSGYDNTTGTQNVFSGYRAGRNNEDAGYNTFIGADSGFSNTSGTHNTFLGYYSGYGNTTGVQNIAIGRAAGRDATTGANNVFLGTYAGLSVEGSTNIMIGTNAGYNVHGNNSIMIGPNAGYDETSGERLHIGTSSDKTLIYGEFDNDLVKINDDLYVNSLGTSDFLKSTADLIEGDSWSNVNLSEFNNDLTLFDGLYTSLDFTGTTGLDDGIDNVDDADNDATNELQDLSYDATNGELDISDGIGVDLSTIPLSDFNNDLPTSDFDAMDFYEAGGVFWYRAEDAAGAVLGDPLGIQAGSNISLTQVGNGIQINSTAASTQWVDLGSSLSSNNHDIIVNDLDFTERGTQATSLTGQDANGWATDVTLGSGLTLSSGILTASGDSPWTWSGQDIRPTVTNRHIFISDGLEDAGGSDGNNGQILMSTGTQVDWVDPEDIDLSLALNMRTASGQTESPGSYHNVDFNGAPVSIGGSWVNATQYTQIPKAGYYEITFTGTVSTNGATTSGVLGIYDDSTLIGDEQSWNSAVAGARTPIAITVFANMAAGSRIYVKGLSGNGQTWTVHDGNLTSKYIRN